VNLVHVRSSVQAIVGAALIAALVSGCGGSAKPSADPTAVSTQSVVNTLIDTGLSQLAKKDMVAAKKTFDAARAIEPGNVYVNYNLGYIAQQGGDTLTAVRDYTAAISADAKFAPAMYNLAILTEPSDLKAAVALYRRVLTLKPKDVGTHLRLGRALKKLGQTAEGDAMIAKAHELDPSLAGN